MMMPWTKTNAGIAMVVIVVVTAIAITEHRGLMQLRTENHLLKQQLAQSRADLEKLSKRTPHLPALLVRATMPMATNLPPADLAGPTNLFSRLYDRLKDKQVKLTPEQVEAFLKANGRSPGSLLAAFRTSGDRALLREAMEKYSGNPQVAFEAVAYNLMHSQDVPAAEQRQWLDNFQKSAPNNALANYLSAINYFNSGQIEQGVQDMAVASGKPLDDYTVGRAENDVEAYLSAGYSVADADVLGTSQLLLPQLSQLKRLAQDSVDLANAYRQSGDITSAQTVLQMADRLGQQYSTPSAGEPTISQLVGIAIERMALTAMDPSAPYGDNGQTAQDQLNLLLQQRTQVQQTGRQAEALLPSLSDQDWIIYKNRWLMLGENDAEQWVISKYGQQ